MRKILLPLVRPALMMLAFAVGYFFPVKNAQWTISYLLMVMLFFVFLRMHFGEIRFCRSHLYLVLLNFTMGLLPFLILKYAGFPDLALGAFFTGITPTATAAPVIMSFLGGRVPYVVTAFLATNTAVSAAMPLLIFFVHGGSMPMPEFLMMTGRIAMVIVLPALLAWGLRRIVPSLEEHAKKTGNLSFLLWVTVLYVISSNASIYLRTHAAGKTALAIAGMSLACCILNFTLGYFCGGKKYRREASQSLGQKNTTLTIYLASSYGNPLAALGPTSYVLWHNSWNALQMYLHEKQKRKDPFQ